MSSTEGILSARLVNRVKAILLQPKLEWAVIDKEQTDIATLYRTYVIPLAAIGPIASFIGAALVGPGVPGVVRTPIVTALVGAIIAFALALVGVYVIAQVADNMAPTYGGTRNLTQAFKVAAYSSTAQWLAGIFAILPGLRGLSILGLYSFYLLYLGLPVLMKVPQEKALPYTGAVVVVSLIVFVVIAIVTGIVVGSSYLY
jgi:hypothetical protein